MTADRYERAWTPAEIFNFRGTGSTESSVKLNELSHKWIVGELYERSELPSVIIFYTQYAIFSLARQPFVHLTE